MRKKYNYELTKLLSQNCLEFNASTYTEFVHFTVSGSPNGFRFAVELLLSVFDDISISQSDFIKEKKRIKAEIREEAEKRTLRYFSDSFVWNGTSLAKTITGTCGNVDKISIKQLNEFKNKYVTANNSFFFLTGNVSCCDIKYLEDKIDSCTIPYGTRLENIIVNI